MFKPNYAKMEVKGYQNVFRKISYWIATRIVYKIYFALKFKVEVNGKENIPKDNKYILAPNHLSTLDPPLTGIIIPHFISYMTKQELFEVPFFGQLLNLLGSFAVNREHLCPSTIKTAKAVAKTSWVLGVFPEGTRGIEGAIGQINKGFVVLAKANKCGILPFGILGTNNKTSIFHKSKIIVNIGEIIPYDGDTNQMVSKWIKSMENLTGYKYIGD